MSATVIIPTTGAPELRKAVDSVIKQTHKDTVCYVVIDGEQNYGKTSSVLRDIWSHPKLKVASLPINVGANGFYGHRVYASFSHLVNTDYVLYLDQDNWFDPNHVQSCIDLIEANGLQWCHSLRKIADKDGNYICNDDCESLGKYKMVNSDYNHCDTNTYCLPKITAIQCASAWHGGWGQDRVFLKAISKFFPKFDGTGQYTVNYRIGGNDGSVRKEFFEHNNAIMNKQYNGEFPWRKENLKTSSSAASQDIITISSNLG
jgi:glycosyltransferase involved in cell wall biosynthesis